MWLDEGFTLTRLTGTWQGIPQCRRHAGHIHDRSSPSTLLCNSKAWGLVIGDSEFALKLIPALASIVLIPATYVLARRLFTRRIALMAALLAFLSPAYQWYGHELRMYTVVPLLAALSNYSLYVAIQPRKMGASRWLIWIGAVRLVVTHALLLVRPLCGELILSRWYRSTTSKVIAARLCRAFEYGGVGGDWDDYCPCHHGHLQSDFAAHPWAELQQPGDYAAGSGSSRTW